MCSICIIVLCNILLAIVILFVLFLLVISLSVSFELGFLIIPLISSKFPVVVSVFDICFTGFVTAVTTILPVLFLYLNTVIVTAGTFEP